MKLITKHIEDIRNYFLAESEEKRQNILKNLQSPELLEYILSLKNDFHTNNDLNSRAIDEHKEELLQIQRDYYTHLADQYNSGLSNPNIKTLLEKENKLFLEELAFQQDLKLAFNLNERSTIKQQLKEFEASAGLANDEITNAFKLAERKKLKTQFKEIENKEANVANPKTPVITINWKRLAVAASVVGILAITSLLLLNKKEQSIAIAKKASPGIKNTAANYDSAKNELAKLLTKQIVPTTNTHPLVVKQQYAMGFAPKEEQINWAAYDTEADITELNAAILQNGKTIPDSILTPLKNKIDSLKLLRNEYRFSGSHLILYTVPKKPVKIFKINKNYYLQVDELYYECRKSKNNLPLKKLLDKSVRDEIFMIDL